MKSKILALTVGLLLIVNVLLVAVGGLASDRVEVTESVENEPEDPADSPWPIYGHDLKRTGRSPYNTSHNEGIENWGFGTNNAVKSSPVIGPDGTIYVGSDDGNLYAINPNGSKDWKFATNGKVRSSPCIGTNGTIYVGSYDNTLYAVNPDGTEKWNFSTGGDVYSSPIIGPGGTIYFGSCDNKLYAVNPDGTEKWNFSTGNDVESSPALSSEGTIYVGSENNNLYAINPDGTEKWNFTTGYIVSSTPTIGSDGTIYVGSWDDDLYAINPDGTEKWNFTTGADVRSSAAIGPDGTIYIGSVDSKLYAINQDGTERWNFATESRIVTSPAIGAAGTIYVGSVDNYLYAINPNGTEKWSFSGKNPIESSPSIASDGTIYIGTDIDFLYAVGNPDLPTVSISSPVEGANISTSSVTVKWSGSDNTSGIGYYEVRRDGGDWMGVGTETSWPFTFYSDGVHSVGVKAVNNNGNSATDIVNFTVDTALPTVSISSPSEGDNISSRDVTVEWSGSDDRSGIDHYKVQIDSSGWTGVGMNTSHTFTSLSDGAHNVDVEAVDGAGNRATDDVGFNVDITSLPSAPQNLQASAGSGQVELTWEAPLDDGGSSITDYNIYRGTSSESLSQHHSVDGSTTSYTDQDVQNGQTYHYQVSAVNSAGEGNRSEEVSAAPSTEISTPSAPQGIQASAVDGQVELSWEVPLDDGGSSITEYNIYRGTSSESLSQHHSVDGSTTSYTDQDVQNGQTYYYKVSAVNSAGEGNRSEEVSATPSTEISTPSAPQNLQASSGDEQVELTWEAPSDDGGSKITEYNIYRGMGSGDLTHLDSVNGSTTSYADTDLTNNQTYYYQVSAVNNEGEGNLSAEIDATPSKGEDQNGDGTDDGTDNETDNGTNGDDGGTPGFTTMLLLLSGLVSVAIYYRKKR